MEGQTMNMLDFYKTEEQLLEKSWLEFLVGLFIKETCGTCFIAALCGQIYWFQLDLSAQEFFTFRPIETVLQTVLVFSGVRFVGMIGEKFRYDKKSRDRICPIPENKIKRILPVFFIIIMLIVVLLVLAGCAASGSAGTQTGDSMANQNSDATGQTTDSTAGMVIASNEISPDGGYAFSIEMTNGRFNGGGTFIGIDGGGTFTGSFDIVLYDGVEETDRMSLNDIFGQDSLSFAAHAFSKPATPRYILQNTLFGSDYNSDGNIDVAIGFE